MAGIPLSVRSTGSMPLPSVPVARKLARKQGCQNPSNRCSYLQILLEIIYLVQAGSGFFVTKPVLQQLPLPPLAATGSSRQLHNNHRLLLPFVYIHLAMSRLGIPNPRMTTRPPNTSLIHPRQTTDSRMRMNSRRHGLIRTASTWRARS